MLGNKPNCRLIRSNLIGYTIELPNKILSKRRSVGKVAAAIEFTSQTDFIVLQRGGLCKLMKWRSSSEWNWDTPGWGMRNLLQKYSFLIWRSENCSARNVHAAIFIYQICVLHLIAWRELIADSKEQFVYEKCQAWLVSVFLFFLLLHNHQQI